ncbi:AAA family ATPase [Amycolatopsis rhabdoformis]|uniref:AAA family ATPase n=1 Tax=Amycolatopsis rhabdoformis TaxID=1448059 RepID=A0ABZ1I4R1_9PSEU|nr:AAA family ATPase [Amycolatopsis rhabdoformis]WSE29270.1 AAA family ATPase [Amycolatopsis rhabdoformis]
MRLIVLNGPPAIGKSTLAARFAEDHPPALNLDIDRIRVLVGGWRERPRESGEAARALALAAARAHLTAGHDVVVPQLLARPDFLLQLENLAHETGAALHELVLWDSRDNVLNRFADRVPRPEHHETTAAEVGEFYDHLEAFLAERPRARVITTAAGHVDEAYRAVLAALH